MMGVSLDGMVARSGGFGAGGWGVPPEDPALKARKLDWLGDAGLHLMGRVTYEEMAGFWPVSDDEYAAPMNDIPKVVFSKTLTKADWAQSTIASGDLADEIGALKREPGQDMIAWGGAAFAQSLSRLRLPAHPRLVAHPWADLAERRLVVPAAVTTHTMGSTTSPARVPMTAIPRQITSSSLTPSKNTSPAPWTRSKSRSSVQAAPWTASSISRSFSVCLLPTVSPCPPATPGSMRIKRSTMR